MELVVGMYIKVSESKFLFLNSYCDSVVVYVCGEDFYIVKK